MAVTREWLEKEITDVTHEEALANTRVRAAAARLKSAKAEYAAACELAKSALGVLRALQDELAYANDRLQEGES
jgi:hypothetical protein